MRYFPLYGRGETLYTPDGNEIIDLCSGEGSAILGLQPEEVIAAVNEQLNHNVHCPVAGRSELEKLLSNELLDALGLAEWTIIPATTGSEAIDSALRIARRFTGRSTIAFVRGAYHGVTTSAIAVCGIAKWRHPGDEGGLS